MHSEALSRGNEGEGTVHTIEDGWKLTCSTAKGVTLATLTIIIIICQPHLFLPKVEQMQSQRIQGLRRVMILIRGEIWKYVVPYSTEYIRIRLSVF